MQGDLFDAMTTWRHLQQRRQKLLLSGKGDSPECRAINADLGEMEPLRRAYIRWRFFGEGRPEHNTTA